MAILSHEQEETVYRIEAQDGYADFTDYALFPGVHLVFNDVHCETLPGENDPIALFEINYCTQGLFECAFAAGGSTELREGGFAACCPHSPKSESRFPLGRYRGMTVTLDLDLAQQHMDRRYPELALTLWDLPERLCPMHSCLTLPASHSMRAVFQSIGDTPDRSRVPYYRIKMLELFSLMSALPPREDAYRAYLPGDKKDTLRHIRQHLRHASCGDLSLAELARAHGLCLTVLKQDFAKLYGITPGAYRRQCRLQQAARMLTDTELSVTDIAARVGYQNTSKFSAAFRQEIGLTPSAYRKTHGLLEHSKNENDLSE